MKPKYSMSAAIKEANKRVFISYGFSIKVMMYKEAFNATTTVASFYYAKPAKTFTKSLRISEALRLYMNENELMQTHHTIAAGFITDLITTSKLRGITSKSTPLAIAKAILDQGFCTIPHLSLN